MDNYIIRISEIIKAFIRCYLNKGIQKINIEKIISSKYDYNDPDVIQRKGYNKFMPILYVNDKVYGKNNIEEGVEPLQLKNIYYDETIDINEKLVPK